MGSFCFINCCQKKAAAFPVENLHAEAEESLWLKKLPRLTHA